MPVSSDRFSQSTLLTPSLGRSASRNAIPLADEGMDRLPPNDWDVHPHSPILNRGKLIHIKTDQLIPQTGLVASVVFSLVLVIQKSTQTRIKIIGRLPGTDEWVPIDEDESAQEEIPGVVSLLAIFLVTY